MCPRTRCAAALRDNLISVTELSALSVTSAYFTDTIPTSPPVKKPLGCSNSSAQSDSAVIRPPSISHSVEKFSGLTFLKKPWPSVHQNINSMKQKPNQKLISSKPELTRRDFIGKTAEGLTLSALFA